MLFPAQPPRLLGLVLLPAVLFPAQPPPLLLALAVLLPVWQLGCLYCTPSIWPVVRRKGMERMVVRAQQWGAAHWALWRRLGTGAAAQCLWPAAGWQSQQLGGLGQSRH